MVRIYATVYRVKWGCEKTPYMPWITPEYNMPTDSHFKVRKGVIEECRGQMKMGVERNWLELCGEKQAMFGVFCYAQLVRSKFCSNFPFNLISTELETDPTEQTQ